MAYDNTNSGIIKRNDKKREGKKDPDYNGSIDVEGVEYWVAAWINEGRPGSKLEGQKYFSVKLTKKDDQPAAAPAAAPKPAAKPAPTGFPDMDDDIPF
ncbi:MAG: hypothetical protein K0Q92_634 [Steroidobacteraceae bacterium]|jgi:hypothetical protein|nr:hypothetical protein [Steroidobacteraceae bacterium]